MNEESKALLKKLSVLVVEDEQSTRKVVAEALGLYFTKVYEAQDGSSALSILKEHTPNVIFTDIKMPKVDGLELTRRIRDNYPKLPIVILSAYAENQTLLELVSLKLTSYLIKPVDFQELEKVLEKCACELEECGMIEEQLCEDIVYSFSKKALLSQDKVLPLQPKEILFLELLLEHKNKLVTKEEIALKVYDGEFMSASAINNLVLKLRKKVGHEMITTVSSLGFMMVTDR